MSRFDSYRLIEEYRKRPLIVYATSTRPGVVAQMAEDAVREFIDQVDAIGKSELRVDILMHSTGGDPLTAWKLMSVLRERFEEVGVLVPFMAFSAATLFALGADEIVMHPHASLGPIDPQITVNDAGKEMHFAYEDVDAFIRFITEDVKLSEQAFTSEMAKKLCEIANPLVIGASKRASSLSEAVGERMLLLHMDHADSGKSEARKIAKDLNRGFFAHGDAVSRTRARELNLKIAEDNQELEKLIWDAFLGLESHMQLRTPFNPFDLYMADEEAAASIVPPPALRLPPDAPPPFIDHVLNQCAAQILGAQRAGAKEVRYELIHAVVESTKMASSVRSSGMILAARMPDGGIKTSLTPRAAEWSKSEHIDKL